MGLKSIYKGFLLIIISFLLSSGKTFSAHDNKPEGGKAAAMSNTSVTLTDIWSVYHNQAGLGFLENITIGAFHQSGYIKEQNLQGITLALPTKTGTIATSYSYYGYSQYNETQAGLAFGRTFSKLFAIGLQLNYLYTQIAGDYGKSSSINFEVGILSQPIENLFVGAHVYNPSRSKMGEEEIPSIINIGISYLFSDNVLLAIGTEKDLNNNAIFKAGIDYQLINYVSLQAGISTNPSTYSFGIGFHYIDVNAHVGFKNHQTLGFTPSFTLSYGF